MYRCCLCTAVGQRCRHEGDTVSCLVSPQLAPPKNGNRFIVIRLSQSDVFLPINRLLSAPVASQDGWRIVIMWRFMSRHFAKNESTTSSLRATFQTRLMNFLFLIFLSFSLANDRKRNWTNRKGRDSAKRPRCSKVSNIPTSSVSTTTGKWHWPSASTSSSSPSLWHLAHSKRKLSSTFFFTVSYDTKAYLLCIFPCRVD